jgi:hypothetical protein
LTLAEVAQLETSADPLPAKYHGLANLLQPYVKFLRHLVGERSGHFVEVMQITVELNLRQFIFEALRPDHVASLLLQVFMDARRFFSTDMDSLGNRLQSLLQMTYNEVAIGIVQAHLNVLYAQRMGNNKMDEPLAYPDIRPTRGATSSSGSRTFCHVPALIKTILQGA